MPWWVIILMIAAISTGALIGAWAFWPGKKWLQETEEAQAHELELLGLQHKKISGVRYFFRGFFLRLVYGSMAIPLFALLLPIRTHLLNRPLPSFLDSLKVPLIALSVYLVICILGGFIDAARKPPALPLRRALDVKSAWQKTPRRIKIGTSLMGVWVAYTFLFGG